VLRAPSPRPGARWSWQSYPARVVPGGPLGQAAILAFLDARGIAAQRGVANAHQEPAYAGDRAVLPPGGLPVSERLRDETVLLPLYQSMTEEELRQVADALTLLAARAGG
jgi:dTDP-4-amino-4,6-dideoxygalactose transaminase